MDGIKDFGDFDKAGWCFRDVNFGKDCGDVEKTLKNLKSHILDGVLSPRERGLWAAFKNIPALNKSNEICVGYGSEVASLFGFSGVQVMFNPEEVGIRRTPGQNVLHSMLHIVRDEVDITKRQVQGILVLSGNDTIIPEILQISEQHDLPVYSYMDSE